MLKVTLPLEIVQALLVSLRKAGNREIGGVLMAEHMGPNEFKIRDITVHRCGAVASFVRRIEEAIGKLRSFFHQTNHDYRRFNYLGEWHSHPLFEPTPSAKDDVSMLDIVRDESVGANFAVLLIVKLHTNGEVVGSAYTYLPNGMKVRSTLVFERT